MGARLAVCLLALAAAPAPAAAAKCKIKEWKCPERDGRGCCTKPAPVKPFLARVTIDSAPAGAELSIDGELKGTTPWTGRLAPGAHEVALALAGHDDLYRVIRVKKTSGAQETFIALAKRTAPLRACPPEMVSVPGGTFVMGAKLEDHNPPHRVRLSPYCIDRTEVTAAAYGECVAAGECAEPGSAQPESVQYCNRASDPARSNHPANCISWDAAARYCARAGKRLPTEAEWEYAARGKDGRLYPWGNQAPTPTRLNAWGKQPDSPYQMYVGDDGWADSTAPVGSYPLGVSPFGALDMAGNVREAVSDWYGTYAAEAAVDPAGPPTGSERVVRGGDFSSALPEFVQANDRYMVKPAMRYYFLGVRCALSNQAVR